jgi:hypothetical protein
MAKRAISVTLDTTNLVWLKARVGASDVRSVSELLDRLITSARTKGSGHAPTSVVGTIDIDRSDPLLLKADDAIRAIYEQSLRRPLVVKEARAPYGRAMKNIKRSRRG